MNDARLQFNHAMAEDYNFPPCQVDESAEIPAEYNWKEDSKWSACVQPVR